MNWVDKHWDEIVENPSLSAPIRGMGIVVHRDDGDGRWIEVDGQRYGVTYGGPGWGWAIHSDSGAVLADGYLTLAELRADADRAVVVASASER